MLNRRLLRTKVIRSLYSHKKSERNSVEATLAEYNRSITQCYSLYVFLLQLLVEITKYGKKRQQIAREKLQPTKEDLNPNTQFVENRVIKKIAESNAIQEYLKTQGLNWGDYESEPLVRELYNSITGGEKYEVYLDGAISDRAFVIYVLRNFIEDNTLLEQILEDISMLWADDLGYALGMAIQAVEIKTEGELLPMFSVENGDQKYAENLLLHSIKNFEEYHKIIEQNSDNWEVERIAEMDVLVLVVAMSELVGCPTIPVKVTLNEYIEISKYYSTPQSYNFINGVLHRVVEKFEGEGKINKTGRGLQ